MTTNRSIYRPRDYPVCGVELQGVATTRAPQTSNPPYLATYRQPSPLPIYTHALTTQESREAGEPERVRKQAHPVAPDTG